MKKNYKLKLTTLTPVCIGTGNKLSPYADYVIDNKQKKIYYIDQYLVKTKLAATPTLINEYVSGILNGMDNNRSKFNIAEFLKNRLKIDIIESSQISLNCEATGGKELHTIVKNADAKPYIPGSSLKGAFKTALLYDWLVSTKEGQSWVSSFVLKIKDKDERAKLEATLAEHLQSFEKLSLSDSSLIDTNKVFVIETKRIHIGTGDDATPQVWEAILEDSVTEISFRKPEDYPDISSLLQSINNFSLDNNRKELALLNKWGTNFQKKFANDYEDLVEFYETYDTNIGAAKSGEAFLRVGSGKGYFFNSVGTAIANYQNGKHFDSFIKFYGRNYKIKDSSKFPTTRPIDLSSFKPLGWVKIELVN